MTTHAFKSTEPPTVGTATAPTFCAPSSEAVGVVAPISSAAATASSQPVAAASVLRICSHAITFAAAAESLTQSSLKVITAFIEGFVMRTVYEEKIATAAKNARTLMQADARTCSALVFGKVCKAIWPFKTAEELAARVGCSVRAAAYELSGEREPSVYSLQVVINEMIPKKGRA